MVFRCIHELWFGWFFFSFSFVSVFLFVYCRNWPSGTAPPQKRSLVSGRDEQRLCTESHNRQQGKPRQIKVHYNSFAIILDTSTKSVSARTSRTHCTWLCRKTESMALTTLSPHWAILASAVYFFSLCFSFITVSINYRTHSFRCSLWVSCKLVFSTLRTFFNFDFDFGSLK